MSIAILPVDRQIRNLNALLRVSKLLGSEVKLDSLLELILEITTGVMEAERTSLFLYDGDTQELRSKVAQGILTKEIRFSINTGIAGEVARTLKISNIPNAYLDPRFNPEFDKMSNFRTNAVLCLPIIGRFGKLLGVIQVLNKKSGGSFNSEDEILLDALAAHISVALERVKLIEAYVENQRMDESLKLAREIQMSMSPKKFPPIPSKSDIIDIYAYIEPAKIVGGDLYDFFLIDEDHLCFVTGDVSGKGVSAAIFMAITNTALRAIAIEGRNSSEIVTKLNNLLCQNNVSDMFCTFFCGILNLKTGEIEFCNAGHPLPYVLSKNGSVVALKQSDGIILGIIENQNFKMQTIILGKGDGIFLYTDGINEATNVDNEQYSYEKLEKILKDSTQLVAKDVVERVIGDVEVFMKSAPQSDDICALMIRYL